MGTGHIIGRPIQQGGEYSNGDNGEDRSEAGRKRNKVGRREVIMPRCGVHQGGEYKRINTVSSISNKGEAGSDEGNRKGST